MEVQKEFLVAQLDHGRHRRLFPIKSLAHNLGRVVLEVFG